MPLLAAHSLPQCVFPLPIKPIRNIFMGTKIEVKMNCPGLKAGAIHQFFFLKSPRFQALMNSAQARGLKIFCGGTCPA